MKKKNNAHNIARKTFAFIIFSTEPCKTLHPQSVDCIPNTNVTCSMFLKDSCPVFTAIGLLERVTVPMTMVSSDSEGKFSTEPWGEINDSVGWQ